VVGTERLRSNEMRDIFFLLHCLAVRLMATSYLVNKRKVISGRWKGLLLLLALPTDNLQMMMIMVNQV
jgi:hypothetical protein